jgi:hypothetical protein
MKRTTRPLGDPERAHAPPAKQGRASAEAVMKRRAARHFNDVLLGGAAPNRLDGRTAKRRLRLLEELKQGASRSGKRELKPIDVLLRVQALLDLEEPVASIKRARGSCRPVPLTDAVVDGVRALHAAYGFSPAAYQFVGIDDATLRRAGLRRSEGRKATTPDALHKTGTKRPRASERERAA